jgi:hypothetical protein
MSNGNGKMSLSDAIRAELRATPEAKPAQIVKALADKGIAVKVGLVNAIKARERQKGQAAEPDRTIEKLAKALDKAVSEKFGSIFRKGSITRQINQTCEMLEAEPYV